VAKAEGRPQAKQAGRKGQTRKREREREKLARAEPSLTRDARFYLIIRAGLTSSIAPDSNFQSNKSEE